MTNDGHPESEADRMAQRDAFAMAALVGMLSNSRFEELTGVVKLANSCYVIAEAMMEVRKGRPLP